MRKTKAVPAVLGSNFRLFGLRVAGRAFLTELQSRRLATAKKARAKTAKKT